MQCICYLSFLIQQFSFYRVCVCNHLKDKALKEKLLTYLPVHRSLNTSPNELITFLYFEILALYVLNNGCID